MSLLEIAQYIGSGGCLIFLLAMFIEWTPIEINPIGWLGKHFNASTKEQITSIEKKLDEHIAQSYRNKILSAQDALLHGNTYTKEQFDEIIEACTAYENYCKTNIVQNDKCSLAIGFIKREYKKCQNNRSFANLPDGDGDSLQN